jgi:dUTPase
MVTTILKISVLFGVKLYLITIKLPAGVYGRIASRSGLALLNKLNVLGGVIDK